jgi:hypothetical protein
MQQAKTLSSFNSQELGLDRVCFVTDEVGLIG